jgi:hypothetical protein
MAAHAAPPSDPRIRGFADALAEAIAAAVLRELRDETGESATPENNGARQALGGEASAIEDKNSENITHEAA